jgi:uncharacterized protein YlxP (DUF503 family)
MKAGVLTLRCRLHTVESLKGKRSIVKHLLAEIDRCGPAFAACEVDDQDDLRSMTIRIAHVSNDPRFTDSVLSGLRDRLDRGIDYDVEEAVIEIL